MSIRDYKITDEQFNEKGMTSLPDTLKGTPYENKKSLEKFTREVVAPQFNAIVDNFADMEESANSWSAEEAQRVQQENARQSAEQGRVSAEGQRATNETARLLAEENRISAENDRVTAETARVNAENGRVSAEAGRRAGEKARNVWEMYSASKAYVPGNKVSFGDGTLTAVVDETMEDGNKYVTFYYDTETLYEKLDEFGKMPLPPYITKQLEDQSQYQTVYAKELGSAAAPTAGLHFTPQLMDTIRSRGVNIAEVTLHVGLGTFRPVNEESIEDHQMHSEWYSVSEETAKLINETRAAGHRVIAVGTTSCRTLESVWAKYGKIVPCSGNTSIFIYPGIELKAIDGLITNFHLPESTLIMLIAAFYGYDKTMAAYKVAVEEKYRFFSFGDAMFIR